MHMPALAYMLVPVPIAHVMSCHHFLFLCAGFCKVVCWFLHIHESLQQASSAVHGVDNPMLHLCGSQLYREVAGKAEPT